MVGFQSWKLESYLKDMGMTGPASDWAMHRRRPKQYHRNVDAATRCSGVLRLDRTTALRNSIFSQINFGISFEALVCEPTLLSGR